MRFRDSSALVPLVLVEPRSGEVSKLFREDSKQAVWWGTEVECLSAIRRHEREGSLTAAGVSQAIELLAKLAASWTEVLPGNRVTSDAARLLATHPLRAGDALQLAAAISWRSDPGARADFTCLDDRLVDAASREGFRTLPAPA
ncbi:MAG: type II toxin-antitoxin system VapC family toxin [Solirubrobacterales bacterium]|nr:type II toxin-antitoxin system VapC family toxin [Solirubrobacterales bacterium]